ncbi:hypothetical protein NM688_g5054 [Phlebia brevispora]|uniref:Uncharacterized protein n=1 Tax=Phlebia brevispora TaxID=194682 RepID=A0ACC1T1F7_9APHY|nr:hypothetical protein NM688_g5054 [Phlebia brevispora]
MEVVSGTVEVIALVKKVYDRCVDYKEADKTIEDARIQLQFAKLKLELFRRYLEQNHNKVPESNEGLVHDVLRRVGDLTHDLEEKLPSVPTVAKKLTWVGWGKRRAESLVGQLKTWNFDIKELFFILAVIKEAEMGEFYDRLSQEGGDAQLTGTMGLNKRIKALDTAHEDLRLPPLNPSLLPLQPTTGDKFLATYGGLPVYVEVHSIDDGDNGQKTRQVQIYQLFAYTFHDSSLPATHLLSCKGILQHDSSRCYTVFDLPDRFFQASPPPSSVNAPTLSFVLEQKAHIRLEDCYRIALEASRAVLSIHGAGWVHKNIRSDNILVDTRADDDPKSPVIVGTAYLVGFQTTRPQLEESARHPEVDPVKRRYHHPERQGGRDTEVARFDIRHDMYSLGAVLVEIGYRHTLRELWPVHTSFSDPSYNETKYNHEMLVKHARRLSEKMGSRYAGAAMACLTATVEGHRDAAALRKEFTEKVLRPLKEIVDTLKANPFADVE